MHNNHALLPRKAPHGFALPAILVVVGALLILAVASLLIIGIERNTARSFTDRQRAELATRAGLDDFRGILKREADNDDYFIIQGTEREKIDNSKESPPYLYLARGSGAENSLKYRYQPLFTAETTPTTSGILQAPFPEDLVSESTKELNTLPWLNPTKLSWVTIKDPKSKIVSRYAYWVEDLQGKLDGRVAGNPDGRPAFPAPTGIAVDDKLPALSSVAIGVLDPKATDETLATVGPTSVTQKIITARPAMLSPESIIGATGILASNTDSSKTTLERDEETGLLEDPVAATMEREVSPVLQAYKERPVVPFSAGLSKDVIGQPKLNLNKLLEQSRNSAVDEFATRIDDGLPNFENNRRGAFPNDYLQTLAASAFDYADKDNDPTISNGAYIGIDAYPFMSEVVLQINFMGSSRIAGVDVQRWVFKLYIELWNMSNQPVAGSASFSYEVDLTPEPMGAGSSSSTIPFDSPSILNDKTKSSNNLTNKGGKFYTSSVGVDLLPDQYKFYEVATVTYSLPDASGGQEFDLIEPLGSRGITMMWNDQPVHVIPKLVRDAYGVSNFKNSKPEYASKAAIPGHSYGPYGSFVNNMGDPRITNYLNNTPLGENAYPDNVSPGRRNIRRGTIYDGDSTEKRLHYGRVLPSEWPDGGHDSPVTSFPKRSSDSAFPTDASSSTGWPTSSTPLKENAVQRISNLGVFYSATELGRVYDPILWQPSYPTRKSGGSSAGDSTALLSGNMPASRNAWPEVSNSSFPSPDYGGGNTLRIGRPEHERFDRAGDRASQLLDLFHVGMPNSTKQEEREGEFIEIKGNINVNTAGKTALRAMAAGFLTQDPELRKVTSWAHETNSLFRPQTSPIELGAPAREELADKIADAILLRRPFASAAELAAIRDENDDPVFGNRDLYTDVDDIQWSDAAAEEVFARVYDASTVRSRNFRIWVIGQAISGSEDNPVILSESRKVFTVFADPGERKSDGSIDPAKYQPRVTYENDF
jgi:hypothetical protein